jgi:hypothetical protein
MEDMIKQIISMDEQAQALKEAAEQEKAHAEQQIVQMKEAKYEEYLAKARERIKKNAVIEQTHADKQLVEIKEKHAASLAKINALYKEKGQAWIDEIVKRVIA